MSEKEVIYVCERTPNLKFRLEETHFKFKDSQLKLTNAHAVNLLDEFIESGSVLSSTLKKVDKHAAEQALKKALKEKGPMGGAVKGGLDAQNIMNSQKPLEERDAAFSGMDPTQMDEMRAKLAADDLILTERSAKEKKETLLDLTKSTE